jgi:hypothetical protein
VDVDVNPVGVLDFGIGEIPLPADVDHNPGVGGMSVGTEVIDLYGGFLAGKRNKKKQEGDGDEEAQAQSIHN